MLQSRLPDAVIDFPCTDANGKRNAATAGECTSVLWGYNELILEADIRARKDGDTYEMWSGLIRPAEWATLQLPGKILGSMLNSWVKTLMDGLGCDHSEFFPADEPFDDLFQ